LCDSRHSKANKRLFTYIATLRRVLLTIVVAENYYVFSVCFSSLSYPAFKGPATHYGILSSVACWALKNGSTLSHERHDILKNIFEYTTCVLFYLQLLSTTFPIPRKNELDTVINVHISSRKIPINKI